MAEGKLPRRFVDLDLGLLFGRGRGILGRNITQNSLLDPQSSTGGVRRDRPKLRSESARDVNKRALVCALLFDHHQFLSTLRIAAWLCARTTSKQNNLRTAQLGVPLCTEE